jgi:hypothetical protein
MERCKFFYHFRFIFLCRTAAAKGTSIQLEQKSLVEKTISINRRGESAR